MWRQALQEAAQCAEMGLGRRIGQTEAGRAEWFLEAERVLGIAHYYWKRGE